MAEGMLQLDLPHTLSPLTQKPGTCHSTKEKEQNAADEEPQEKGKKSL
jgi:hypothetical protein